MTKPLVSVITATWGRPGMVRDHAIKSVNAQTYEFIQHIIVTDGTDRKLNEVLRQEGYYPGHPDRMLVNLGRNWTSLRGPLSGCGGDARRAGCYMASGDWIAYLDDDDDWLPNHVADMVRIGEETQAQMVNSAWIHGILGRTFGDPTPMCGMATTSALMHRPEILKITNWQPWDGYEQDGRLIERWRRAGVSHAFKSEPTMILSNWNQGKTEEDIR